mgnify:CR=1 FL=1
MTNAASTSPKTALLVGCGQLGAELGQRLTAQGTQVYGLRRNATALPTAFVPLAVDLTQPVTQPLPEVDTMVITLTPTMPEVNGQPGYLVALQHLAEALPKIPGRVVFVSSTRVFDGNPETQPLTEEDVPAPVSDRAQLLVEAERLAAELFDAALVRPAGIYGPGREMLIRTVRAGEAVNRRRRTNRIHQSDLARLLALLLTMPNPPAVLHAVDQTPGVPLGEVVDYIAQRLHLTPPPGNTNDVVGGKILDARLLHTLLGPLYYPTYQQGYDQVIAEQSA